ncbi:MAG: 23S rRNA (adenine(2503)-C(2))-methyltransferase RlmN [Deltaproteobacteria bacterium]|nr:23S rRNA (adenine(2503)-C(2))-methyltransferase RlmN [Deltaproteobacteria bacterium]
MAAEGSGYAPRELADHDLGSLAALLAARTGQPPGRSRRAAAQALRLAFGMTDGGSGGWTRSELGRARIGAWAQSALLDLSPAPCLRIARRFTSADGTTRLLLRARDGAGVEAVIIPALPAKGQRAWRTTLCLSSQAGCARGCAFCHTGRLGLRRNLRAAEIVDQYRLARDELAPSGEAISNLVFMGMGEPLDNFDAVMRAIRLMCDPHAFALAPSRITVATAGVADKVADFFAASRAELAVSVNAPDDARRQAIMPIARAFDLGALRRALVAALPPRRRLLLTYVLFEGFNDAPDDADMLARWARGLSCRINLIPANPGPDARLVPPTEARLAAFAARLSRRGLTTLVRAPRGRDVGAACGQLAGSWRRAP